MATSVPVARESKQPSSLPGESAKAPVGAAPPRRLFVGIVVVLTLAALGAAYWVHPRHLEDTDDAQIDGTISNISPRLNGYVQAVYVTENQAVKAGDVLAEVDPTDLRIALAQARAQVAQAEAQLDAENPSVPIAQSSNESAISAAQSDLAGARAALSAARKDVEQLTAQIAEAEANDRTAQLEKHRSEKLVAQGAVSQSDFDLRSNAAAASAANIEALRQSLAAARDRVSQQQAQAAALDSHWVEVRANAPRQVATRQASVSWRRASLDLANAQLEQAEKNLSYAKITAPAPGIVAKKSIAVGEYVVPGQQVIALAQTESLYVTANYRETQLERVRPGQAASIRVDAIALDLHGTVESIGGATGSRLSVLPPENASGNYVKVVQRIPVRIRIDPDQPGLDRLRIGMSVEPRITVQ